MVGGRYLVDLFCPWRRPAGRVGTGGGGGSREIVDGIVERMRTRASAEARRHRRSWYTVACTSLTSGLWSGRDQVLSSNVFRRYIVGGTGDFSEIFYVQIFDRRRFSFSDLLHVHLEQGTSSNLLSGRMPSRPACLNDVQANMAGRGNEYHLPDGRARARRAVLALSSSRALLHVFARAMLVVESGDRMAYIYLERTGIRCGKFISIVGMVRPVAGRLIFMYMYMVYGVRGRRGR